MKYKIVATKQYRKALKKITHDKKLVQEIETVIGLLAFDSPLPKSYKDHRLVGNLKNFRELYVRPDFLLVYQKHEDMLVVILVAMGSHGNLF